MNSTATNGFNPIHMALQCGHVDIAWLLLDRGFDVNVLLGGVRHRWLRC